MATIRFIPTNVGNTPQDDPEQGQGEVHPHERGEYLDINPAAIRQTRFIPTNVGNTQLKSTSCRCDVVHPHERGEYSIFDPTASRYAGSSPRTWGILIRPYRRRNPRRFIPTNVGNTCTLHQMWTPNPVHPHERGEYVTGSSRSFKADGSSPRTWGIHNGSEMRESKLRFIPTNVGNTPRHPRGPES